jgi:toxin ParE1/3/4
MKLKLADDALWDLQEIANYTWAQWGEDQEQKYLQLLYRTLEQVASDPSRARLRNDLYHGCRMMTVGKHAIFFTIQENIVCVARILHQAMDPYRHLT